MVQQLPVLYKCPNQRLYRKQRITFPILISQFTVELHFPSPARAMASRYEVEVKIQSAKDLKNINWRYGGLKPYAVVWIDPKNKSSTKVDAEGDSSPYWDETLVIPFSSSIEDATLYIDVVHVVAADEDTKPLIGSARLRLSEVVDDVGLGEHSQRTLQLKRPSGRPQGKVEVKVTVREPRYRSSDSYYAPPYGVPPPGTARDFSTPPPPYAAPYSTPPPPYAASYSAPHDPYHSTAPPSGYPYGGYNAPAPAPAAAPYGQSNYGQPSYGQPSYGQPAYGHPEEKKSKYGMGTGLAVGVVAGALGGLAIGEGIEYFEDKVAEDAAERVEDDLGYGDEDF